MGKLIIDGNSVYEVDEACIKEKEKQKQNDYQKESPPKQWSYTTKDRPS